MDLSNMSFDELADYLLQYQLSYRTFLKSLFKSSTMPVAQYHILTILRDKKQMRMSEISEIMSISRPNLTPLIDKLVQLQRVKRISDRNDRRVIYVSITKKGLDALDIEQKELSQHCSEIFVNFSKEDFERFSLALSIIADLSTNR